jgi:hypothetical protein
MSFTKNFDSDLKVIQNFLKEKKNFAFSKYADGEHRILLNTQIRNCDNWFFDPNTNYGFFDMLTESIKYNEDNYYIGISCPCCDIEGFNWYKENKGSKDENTTFANIFVNNNYEYFKKEILHTFNTFDRIVLVANKDSNLEKVKTVLNFTDFYGIGGEAFKTDLHLIEELKSLIKSEDLKNTLFLFCAGPLGNVLSYKLWEFNKNNTYVDIGSTLNIWTEKNIRNYQNNGGVYHNKICKF